MKPRRKVGFFCANFQRCILSHLLRFGHGNAKLPKTTMIFDLPAGSTCPGAKDCLSRFNLITRKIEDGPDTIFRCSAASQEIYPDVAAKRHSNLLLINSTSNLDELLYDSVQVNRTYRTTHVRWHNSGDFFSSRYAKAVLQVAERTPELTHYFYTKMLLLFLDVPLPSNVFLTASWGGKYDHLIEAGHYPRNSRVVLNDAEAISHGLPVDHTDQHAYSSTPHAFCHLVHGSQPAGSVAGKAIQARKKAGQFVGYSR